MVGPCWRAISAAASAPNAATSGWRPPCSAVMRPGPAGEQAAAASQLAAIPPAGRRAAARPGRRRPWPGREQPDLLLGQGGALQRREPGQHLVCRRNQVTGVQGLLGEAGMQRARAASDPRVNP